MASHVVLYFSILVYILKHVKSITYGQTVWNDNRSIKVLLKYGPRVHISQLHSLEIYVKALIK